MSRTTPPAPAAGTSLEYLRKLAKKRLKERRVHEPDCQLATVQLEVARSLGISSWRRLKAQIEGGARLSLPGLPLRRERRRSILVVGGPLDLGAAVREALDEDGYAVAIEPDHERGVESLRESCPDLLILRPTWQRGGGVAELLRIREIRPELPVVVVGEKSHTMSIDMMRAGAADYLVLPVDRDTLSRAMVACRESPARRRRRRSVAPSLRGEAPLRILIVDDDNDVLLYLEQFLTRAGYDVRTNPDPTQALDHVKTYRPHVVLLDVRMPELDGLSVLKQIRARDADVCVVVMTAYPSVDTVIPMMKEGAFDYISKPFQLGYLEQVLKDAVRGDG